jgi:hypothetical protein
VVGVGGAVALAALAPRPRTPSLDPAAAAARLEGKLREQAAGLSARVTTLAELPRLATAVATDVATVRDLTRDELALNPRAPETIAIGQRFKDGKLAALLVLPAGAPSDLAARAGVVMHARGDKLYLSQTALITPRERAEELIGVLTATWPVDLADVFAEFTAAGASGHFEVLAIGGPPAPNAVVTHSIVHAPGGAEAQLVLASPTLVAVPTAWYLGAGVLALAALALAGGLRSGAPRPVTVHTQLQGSPALVTPPAPTPGRIGRYALIRPLGSGGMADVFLARSEGEAGFGRLVALKVLQPMWEKQQPVVNLFLDEARLASALDHPNIVQIYDLGRAADQYYIAMEYVDGADLAALIAASRTSERAVPVTIAVAVLRRICDGLAAAHGAAGPDGRPLNLVHRDVKGANVYVSRNGVVKVGDFGIAKATHAIRVARTEIGEVKGTPGYMAPEHRLGQDVDHRADLYGVGAMAYELLAGKPINLDLLALVARGVKGWPHLTPLHQLRGDMPPELEAIIVRALAYERDDRFADCAELERALAQVAARIGVADDKEIGRWAGGLIPRQPAFSQETAGIG